MQSKDWFHVKVPRLLKTQTVKKTTLTLWHSGRRSEGSRHASILDRRTSLRDHTSAVRPPTPPPSINESFFQNPTNLNSSPHTCHSSFPSSKQPQGVSGNHPRRRETFARPSLYVNTDRQSHTPSSPSDCSLRDHIMNTQAAAATNCTPVSSMTAACSWHWTPDPLNDTFRRPSSSHLHGIYAVCQLHSAPDGTTSVQRVLQTLYTKEEWRRLHLSNWTIKQGKKI